MTHGPPVAIGSTAWYDALRSRSTPVLARARRAAYGAGGCVDQDSFMTADQILVLARAAGARPARKLAIVLERAA